VGARRLRDDLLGCPHLARRRGGIGCRVQLDQTLWTELTTLRFLDGPHGALILGPVGVGKTHLATALGHIAVRRRVGVHMTRADRLFKRLKAARLDNSVDAEMRRLAHVPLLIIDDFCLQALDATETADFYELIVERHHTAATMVTSNREPNEWLALMADPLLAQAAVDRLVSTCHELVVPLVSSSVMDRLARRWGR
jgi:DNA replication protein DnaC